MHAETFSSIDPQIYWNTRCYHSNTSQHGSYRSNTSQHGSFRSCLDNVRDWYDPAKSIEDYEIVIENPTDLNDYQRQLPVHHQLAVTGIQHGDVADAHHLVARLERWDTLLKLEEHVCLPTCTTALAKPIAAGRKPAIPKSVAKKVESCKKAPPTTTKKKKSAGNNSGLESGGGDDKRSNRRRSRRS
jgi:hypothetical protein